MNATNRRSSLQRCGGLDGAGLRLGVGGSDARSQPTFVPKAMLPAFWFRFLPSLHDDHALLHSILGPKTQSKVGPKTCDLS